MIEKGGCLTCINAVDVNKARICCECISKRRAEGRYINWQPSELYTAYLQEVEKNERFRQALTCPECYGAGLHMTGYEENHYENIIEFITEDCEACATIRKEARKGK